MSKIHEKIECWYSRWYVAKLEANAWQVEQDEGHLYEVEKKETKVISALAFIRVFFNWLMGIFFTFWN
jgi:hypothetical protein